MDRADKSLEDLKNFESLKIGEAKIRRDSHRGLKSTVLENDCWQATFLPDYGSKLASLYHKKEEQEFLFQPPQGEKLTLPEYGADFAACDASGFDEVFPTIDASFYPRGKWRGKELPDHGELWSVAWQESMDKNQDPKGQLTFRGRSRQLPCWLEKKVTLKDNELKFYYTLHNEGEEELEFIWAAHPLFQARPDLKIILPEEVDEVINVEDSNPHFGSWGTFHNYPLTRSQKTGEIIDLSQVPPPERNTCRKFYVPRQSNQGYCALHYQQKGLFLQISYPPEKLPYLAVWETLGGFRGDYNIAIEPCTGAFDDLYLAHKTGRVATVAAQSSYNWWLSFSLLEKKEEIK